MTMTKKTALSAALALAGIGQGVTTTTKKAANIAAAKGADTKAAQEHVRENARRTAEVIGVAHDIALAVGIAADAAESMSALVIAARCANYRWEELEAVDLQGEYFPPVPARGKDKMRPMRLSDLDAYRKIKSRLNKLAEKGIALSPDMTSADVKAAIKEPRGKADAAGGDTDSASVPGADKPLQFSDKVSVVKAALACLTEDAAMRAAFAQEIRAVARLTANDEAEKATKVEKIAA